MYSKYPLLDNYNHVETLKVLRDTLLILLNIPNMLELVNLQASL